MKGAIIPVQKMPRDPCQRRACAIQKCLADNKYQEDKCKASIQALIDCCDKHPDVENSPCCAGIRKNNPPKPTEQKSQKT